MKEKYLADIRDIKEIMDRSSRFISLSGLAGVSAGIIALSGAFIGWLVLFRDIDLSEKGPQVLSLEDRLYLILIGAITLLISILVTYYFTSIQSKRKKEKLWDHTTKKMMISLLEPLVVGGIISLILLHQGYIVWILPMTLVFYGLALLSARKYTMSEVKSLGYNLILLGLIAFIYPSFGVICWALGFGLLHIIYGVFMHLKYKP